MQNKILSVFKYSEYYRDLIRCGDKIIFILYVNCIIFIYKEYFNKVRNWNMTFLLFWYFHLIEIM